MSSGSDQMPDILIRDHTAADQPAGRMRGAHRPSPVDPRRSVHRPRRSRERLRDYLTTPERIASWVAADLATPITAEFVIGAYHWLFDIEKSFCMSKTDLQARPIYHRTRGSIEAPPSSSPPWRSAAGSGTRRAGRSGNSSVPPAATAPPKSEPATAPSPPSIPCPPTSMRPSTTSTATSVRTNLSKLRY